MLNFGHVVVVIDRGAFCLRLSVCFERFGDLFLACGFVVKFFPPSLPDPPPPAYGPAEKSNDFFVGASGGSEISSGRWRCFVCSLCCCDSSQGNARATKTFSNLVCRPSSRVRLRVFRHRVAARGDNTSLLSWRRCSRHAPPLAIFGAHCFVFILENKPPGAFLACSSV